MKKIAIPVTGNGLIDNHFGHCEYYNVYTVSENNEVAAIETIKSVQGCGCKSGIADDLANLGVGVMLAGGIGNGAINKLNNAGITVIRGCTGSPEQIVKQYLAGLLLDSGESCEHHHHHEDGHTCNH